LILLFPVPSPHFPPFLAQKWPQQKYVLC
jgi:hypothetical protein